MKGIIDHIKGMKSITNDYFCNIQKYYNIYLLITITVFTFISFQFEKLKTDSRIPAFATLALMLW